MLSSIFCILFHIANDGLPTVVHVDVLDADDLLIDVTQASKNLFGVGSASKSSTPASWKTPRCRIISVA